MYPLSPASRRWVERLGDRSVARDDGRADGWTAGRAHSEAGRADQGGRLPVGCAAIHPYSAPGISPELRHWPVASQGNVFLKCLGTYRSQVRTMESNRHKGILPLASPAPISAWVARQRDAKKKKHTNRGELTVIPRDRGWRSTYLRRCCPLFLRECHFGGYLPGCSQVIGVSSQQKSEQGWETVR
ncbi:hypothetical protein LY78DRAFT_327582 [Colletotrichum sublineola]|nr:hypothetical protein LY78DRAFT_327582 [Colletotrichum sublineola]